MSASADWANAYLEQARADLKGAKTMGASSASTFAMLLQMVFEKFAEAALLRSSQTTLAKVQGSHVAASRMILFLRRNQAILAPMGGPRIWEDVLGVVVELERAHPQLAPAAAPHLEYPWQDAEGVVRYPAKDLAIATRFASDPLVGARTLKFAMQLSSNFDAMFV